MGRKPIYSSAAERQSSYRARKAGQPKETTIGPLAKKRRPPSRPARLVAATEALQNLHDEWQEWRDNQPESFEGTEQYEQLTETVELLEQVLDLLSDINPPLGFGRVRR